MKALVVLIPAGLALLGALSILAVGWFWKRQIQSYVRRSPLTKDLLRPPGHSLRKRIEDLDLDVASYLTALVAVPLFVYSTHISQSYYGGQSESLPRSAFSLLLGIGLTTFVGWRLLNLLGRRKLMILGLEGEQATGEELNQLMLDGCRVFHDIPFPYGNIDHVVVSPSGVFAVNSKMLGKPKGGIGSAEIVVDQQQGIVRFPDREYRIPVKQFETEANWLSKHLSSAVGQTVVVESILALPGWFVKERIGRGSVFVINPCKPKKFFVHNRQAVSSSLLQQIAHQLEQLCRDVEPSFQEKRARWEDKK